MACGRHSASSPYRFLLRYAQRDVRGWAAVFLATLASADDAGADATVVQP